MIAEGVSCYEGEQAMKVRHALWMAGLGIVFAWPMFAMGQIVPEGMPSTGAPPLLTAPPALPPGMPAEGAAPAGESSGDAPDTVGAGSAKILPGLGGLRRLPGAALAPLPRLRGIFTPAAPGGESAARFWFTSEALLMWTKNMNIPTLVTTGPVDLVGPNGAPGLLGNAGTLPLLDKSINFTSTTGGRFTLGGWVLPDVPMGLEVSYLFLGQSSGHRALSENGAIGSRVLAIPFQDAANGGVQSSVAVATPGTGIIGRVDLRVTTQLQGWEVTAGTDFGNLFGVHFIGLAGYRNLSLQENLTFSTTRMNNDPTVGDVFRTTDAFHTANDFNGGQLGLRSDYCVGLVTLTTTGKIALGHIRQETSSAGSLVTNINNGFGAAQTINAGYYALGTNSGFAGRDRIALVPEFQFSANWQPTAWMRLSLGYQFLFINTVARPGDQIDSFINPSQSPAINGTASQTLVGPANPLAPVAHSDFWVQGITAGLELKF